MIFITEKNDVFQRNISTTFLRTYPSFQKLEFHSIQKRNQFTDAMKYRSSRPEVFLGKGVLKMCSKFTEEHLCQIALRHRCSRVSFLYIFRKPFPNNTSGWLLLKIIPLVVQSIPLPMFDPYSRGGYYSDDIVDSGEHLIAFLYKM